MINYLNKLMISICCVIASMCADTKGAEENDVVTVYSSKQKLLLQTKTTPPNKNCEYTNYRKQNVNEIMDNMLNTNSSLSIAIDQLVYSPLLHAKALIISFGKFAYEKPAMAAITATYFMLPIVAAYASTDVSYWSPQYCCSLLNKVTVSTNGAYFTTECSSDPTTARYASGFPGFLDQKSCMDDAQYGNSDTRIYGLEENFGFSDPACTIEGSSYNWAFINTNNYATESMYTTNTPIQASCVPHS